MALEKILVEMRAQSTLICHQEKSLHDLSLSRDIRCRPASHERAGQKSGYFATFPGTSCQSQPPTGKRGHREP